MTFRRYAVERTAFAVAVFLAALFVIGAMYREGGVLRFVADSMRGDLGTSFNGRSVRERATDAAFVSAAVAAGGLLLGLALGAMLSSIPQQRLLRLTGYLLYGAAPIWIGLWFAYYLGFKWDWTPITGYCWAFETPPYVVEPGKAAPCEGIGQWAYHLLLPWLTFSLAFAAIYARVLRAVRLRLRDDGALPADERRQARRIRLLKVAKLAGRDFGFAMGAAFLVEAVFGLPGLGSLMLESINNFDDALSAGAVVAATTVAVAVALAVDLVCGWLEPELRRP